MNVSGYAIIGAFPSERGKPLPLTFQTGAVSEPAWAGWQGQRGRIPPRVRAWLLDQGSLTRRVQCACGGCFRVRLLAQGWGRPLASERRLLGMRRGEIAVIREVQLLCDERPWVFARTLIPAGSLKGAARRLTRLGERPLGAVLFADRRVRRGDTQLARLSPRRQLFAAAAQGLNPPPADLWGRRTLFYYGRHPLLVNEIFLPGIPGPEP